MSFGADLPIILRWWVTILLVGWAAWPLARQVFRAWEDQGYIWAKVIGMVGLTWGMMLLGMAGIASFSAAAMLGMIVAIWGIGWFWEKRSGEKKKEPRRVRVALFVEGLFLATLLGWSWIKAHAPDINGLEKFMDFGFARSIMRGAEYPPADMWFAGESINYYYFGHYMLAALTKLSGLDLAYTFNLMLATLFGMCFTGSYVIGRQVLSGMGSWGKFAGAMLIAYLVTLSGNLQTIYAFTRGYPGREDNPPPFWEIMSDFTKWNEIKNGWNLYWYPNATRFIPYTIHEFPSYSFVVSDIHGHVLNIPMALLAMALLVNMFGREREKIKMVEYGAFGALAGVMFMTNALDGPIYMGLLGLGVLKTEWEKLTERDWGKFLAEAIKKTGVAAVVFIATILPFALYFKPFVSGVAVNCPPGFLAHKPGDEGEFKKIGPLVFEGTEKCQKSPMWMLLLLWGFFLYSQLSLLRKWEGAERKLFRLWGGYALGLILFAEFFYFKDIYPQHFRSNTMFKLGYQAFMMMSIASGYAIVWAIKLKRKFWLLGFLPLMFLVGIYPQFGVRSYFGELKTYHGLYGLSWLERRYPDDAAAIKWLNESIPERAQPVILEANGDSYTDYNRVSTFTGLPTVAGWTVHEWLWRGSYTPIAQRAEEVRQVYENPNSPEAVKTLKKYRVEYVIVGEMERKKYGGLDEKSLAGLGELVFRQNTLTIYKLNPAVL